MQGYAKKNQSCCSIGVGRELLDGSGVDVSGARDWMARGGIDVRILYLCCGRKSFLKIITSAEEESVAVEREAIWFVVEIGILEDLNSGWIYLRLSHTFCDVLILHYCGFVFVMAMTRRTDSMM